MFSAVNDMIPLFRPRRGRDDRDAGEKKLRVGGAAGRPNNADRAQGRTQGGGRDSGNILCGAAHGAHHLGGRSRPRKIKALKRSTQEWQDMRAVHDLRGPCSEKGPFGNA